MKPILFVRCDPSEAFGIAPAAVEGAGAGREAWDALADPHRPDLDDIGGVVLFGSTFNVEDAAEQPFIKEVRELTLEAMDRRVPFLGVCFGAQVLAWALDAEVEKSPIREVGFEPVRVEPDAAADPLLSTWVDGDRVFQWHMDTFALPPGAARLAAGDRIANQAFRAGELAWGIQWHFEIDRPELDAWLDEYEAVADLKATWGKSPAEVRAEADDYLAAHQEKGAETFRRFVEVARDRDTCAQAQS